jgi:hypothetical protein
MRRLNACVIAAVALSMAASLNTACGSGEPRTDAERLARGREIVERMSAKLGSAPAFAVSMSETRDEMDPSGKVRQVTVTRETTVRRPDRLYSKLSGDVNNEVWYDGVGITLVMHNDKVYGQARAPETLDKTLDAINERYGVLVPFSDYVYSAPAKALLADSTTGGWVGRETIDGRAADHLVFKDKGVNWETWIPADGDPLPLRAGAEFPDAKRLRKVVMTFNSWNLAPQIADERFTPAVPEGYEGVAILQRARVLREMPKDDAGEAKK